MERRFGDADGEICPVCRSLVGADAEATRLLGFALFNLSKGNTSAVETLLRKAYVALTDKEWDS